MALRLHGIAASRAARALWLLKEMNQPFEHVSQSYKAGATHTAEFLELNPNGHIPVLEDDGIVVWESMAINLYLARKVGGPLAPASLSEEAEVLRWTFWSVTECEKDALTILMHRVGLPAEQSDEDLATRAEKSLVKPWSVLERHLQSRQYIAGERFTVVDVNVASVLGWAQSSEALMARHPNVAAWLRRCMARPAQQEVRQMARQGL